MNGFDFSAHGVGDNFFNFFNSFNFLMDAGLTDIHFIYNR